MATKTAFTPQEWQTLQWAVTDTMAYLSMADAGFWDTFKEASAAARFMSGVKSYNENVLVRELAGDIKMDRDKQAVSGSQVGMAERVTARVSEAAGLVRAKAPEDAEAFRSFILGVAKATAEAAKGVSQAESQAIAKLDAALG